MEKKKFVKSVMGTKWTITKVKSSTFINAGSICVGQVVECAAEDIVKAHNEALKKKK